MKKLLLILSVFLSVGLFAQTDLTFYQMKGATPQGSLYNPSFFPDAKLYISLPVISGMSVRANAGFSYNDLMTPVVGTDSVKMDLNNWLGSLKPGALTNVNGTVSILQFGIRQGNSVFTLSSNYRFDLNMLYPVAFMDYFVNGNGQYLGEKVEESNLAMSGVIYREIGLGFAQNIDVTGRRLSVGGRVKYLQGIAHIGTERKASVTMETNADTYDMTVQFNNAQFQTAGLNALQNNAAQQLLAPSGNKGLAVDLGANYQFTEKWNFAFAVNDIGYIKWTEDIENHLLTESKVSFVGFDGLDTLNIEQAFSDSLDVWTTSVESSKGFKTSIGPNIYSSASYQLGKNGTATASLALLRAYFGRYQMMYGVGYTHQLEEKLYASTTFSKRGNEPINVGLGFAARLGFFQLYSSINNLSGLMKPAADFRGTDFRLGINFLFGGEHRSQRKTQKESIKRALLEEYGDY